MKSTITYISTISLKPLFWVIWLGVFTGLIVFLWGSTARAAGPDRVVQDVMTVLTEINNVPEGGIPQELFSNCHALAIFPSVYKGGFVVGASFGKGVLVVRDIKTGVWRGPAFLMIGSGSFGWQIGVQATDLVLVIMNKRGVNAFFRNNVTLGGDISVAAGPVGRKLKAGTDLSLCAEVYSYSRTKGFFAGLSLEGAYIHHDYKANDAYYNRVLTPGEILSSGGTPLRPEQNRRFVAFLNKICPKGK